MNSKHHFLRLDGVKVAHSPHMVGDLGSTPSPGIRKGCCLVFIFICDFTPFTFICKDQYTVQVNQTNINMNAKNNKDKQVDKRRKK